MSMSVMRAYSGRPGIAARPDRGRCARQLQLIGCTLAPYAVVCIYVVMAGPVPVVRKAVRAPPFRSVKEGVYEVCMYSPVVLEGE